MTPDRIRGTEASSSQITPPIERGSERFPWAETVRESYILMVGTSIVGAMIGGIIGGIVRELSGFIVPNVLEFVGTFGGAFGGSSAINRFPEILNSFRTRLPK